MIRALLLSLIICLTSTAAMAVPHPAERLSDPALEARARELTRNLRCVVCQNETIEESSADMARDLRLLIRRDIAAGKSDADIIAYLRARYGDFILMTPPVTPRTYLLWLVPLIILTAGAMLAWRSTTRRRRKK